MYFFGLPHHCEPCSGRTLTPVITGSFNMGVPVGGLEWFVDPWSISTTIPPPTLGRPAAGLRLSEHGHYTTPMGLHTPSSCTPTVARKTLTLLNGPTFSAPQLLLLGPDLMLVLHQAVLGAMVNRVTSPDVGIPEPSISSPLPVLPFRPASYATQSLEGKGLESYHGMADSDTWVDH